MAHTLVDLLVHVVFSTKHRLDLITPEIEPTLHRYMSGTIRGLGSRCLALNGIENHVHLLISLSKAAALSDLVRDLKKASSHWMNDNGAAGFLWQEGYGAFSVSPSNVPAVKRYIASQKQRHGRMSYEDEYVALLKRNGLDYDERFLWG